MLRPRSAEHYAITSRSFEPVEVLGSGKSASAFLARKGPLVRVFRSGGGTIDFFFLNIFIINMTEFFPNFIA